MVHVSRPSNQVEIESYVNWIVSMMVGIDVHNPGLMLFVETSYPNFSIG